MATSLNTLVDAFFSQQETSWKTTLLCKWQDIVGNLGQRVRLEKVYEDTVVLGVYDAHWMHQLHMLSHVLLTNINGALPEKQIKRVHFKLVERKKAPAPAAKSTPRSIKTVRVLTQQQQRALTCISDPDLQHALEKYWNRCHQEQV